MTNQIKILAFLALTIIGLCACEKAHKSGISETPISKSSVHRAMINEKNFSATSMDKLTQYVSHDPDVLCPGVARLVASYEMLEGGYQLLNSLRSEEMHNHECCEYQLDHDYSLAKWKLTDSPRVIFDFDGRVKYYEFGLVENNEITSIITVHARREEPHAIAYIFPYVLSYNHPEYDYYEGNYPHRVINTNHLFRPVDINDGELAYENADMKEYWNQIEAQATEEELTEINILRKNALNIDPKVMAEANQFWKAVECAIQDGADIARVDPPCVTVSYPNNQENTFIIHLKKYLGTSDYCRDYTANPYCMAPIQQTHWTGGCGPAGLAWIYRGLRKTYPPTNGAYLPIHGDYNYPYWKTTTDYSYYYYDLSDLETLSLIKYSQVKQAYMKRSMEVDNGLTANFYEKCMTIKWQGSWEFPLLPCHLNGTFKHATEGVYGVSGDKTAKYAADWIHDHNLPVMLLQSDLSHYLVAYGYGGISSTPGGDIKKKNLYFLVTDNGYTIRGNYYKPYWRAYHKCEYYHCVQRTDM